MGANQISRNSKEFPAKLEALVYPSQAYSGSMQQYLDFFSVLFGNELISFGYEKLARNGFYEAISSMPRVAEIFIETKAYQATQVFSQLCFLEEAEHGFIYANQFSIQPAYQEFRKQLDKQLGIYITFYAMQSCLNYKHIFVWNFHAPLKAAISLTEWENQILLCFINNNRSIQYVLDHFKKEYYQNIRKKIVPVKLLEPECEKRKANILKKQKMALFERTWLTTDDLHLKELNLSHKEALCVHFYLQGMTAKEVAKKMFVSRRTVEDYIKHIKQKLNVNSRSEFHAAMEKVNLWRQTV